MGKKSKSVKSFENYRKDYCYVRGTTRTTTSKDVDLEFMTSMREVCERESDRVLSELAARNK